MQEIINNVAKFIIDGHTIGEATEHFGKSESSIKKYLSKIRNPQSEYYDAILSKKLELAQAKIILMGQKKGGMIGKRGRTRSSEEQLRLAQEYLNGITLAKLSEAEGIPISTLHDTIREIKDPQLQSDIDECLYKPKGR